MLPSSFKKWAMYDSFISSCARSGHHHAQGTSEHAPGSWRPHSPRCLPALHARTARHCDAAPTGYRACCDRHCVCRLPKTSSPAGGVQDCEEPTAYRNKPGSLKELSLSVAREVPADTHRQRGWEIGYHMIRQTTFFKLWKLHLRIFYHFREITAEKWHIFFLVHPVDAWKIV